MVSGLDWVGLGGSAAAVDLNYFCWRVCTLEHGVQLYNEHFPLELFYFMRGRLAVGILDPLRRER